MRVINVTISPMFKELLTSCIDLAFPQNCHTCSTIFSRGTRAFDRHLCLDCSSRMKKAPVNSCSLCGSFLTDISGSSRLLCRRCLQKPPAYEQLICCYSYEGAAQELLHQFKYDNRPYLAKTIATLMTNALCDHTNLFCGIDYLVPVPLHPARQREREFNQSQLLAEALSAYFEKPVVMALKKIKNTVSQTFLDPEKRSLNLQNAFSVATSQSLTNKNILLIDDVVTTASTVRTAALALKSANPQKISVLAFAKG